MNQDALFNTQETTSPTVEPMPDPKKYEADRVDCKHMQLHPSTAYSYGCRCRGCYKYHAAMNRRRKVGVLPCAYPECTNARRMVQGARYCEAHTTSLNYVLQPRLIVPVECLVCGEMKPIDRKKRHTICSSCSARYGKLISQGDRYRVSTEMLLRWIADPTCNLCGQRFYTGRQGGKSAFAIDHDHSCCGARSCGSCIRGILCNTCNMSLGHVEKMIERHGVQAIVEYLGLS